MPASGGHKWVSVTRRYLVIQRSVVQWSNASLWLGKLMRGRVKSWPTATAKVGLFADKPTGFEIDLYTLLRFGDKIRTQLLWCEHRQWAEVYR